MLADFVVEWIKVQMPPAVIDPEYWTMYFVLPLRVRMRYMVLIHFPSSNNVAEYEALINGLRITVELGIRWLDVRVTPS